MKVTIVGAGAVGATTAFSLSERKLAREVVLYDINQSRAEGIAADIDQGSPLFIPFLAHGGNKEATRGSDVIVITAGVPEKVGEDRLVPLRKNAQIMEGLMKDLIPLSPNAIVIVVSNPCDVLAYVCQRASGLPKGRVISSGTTLDSSRVRLILSKKLGINPQDIHAYCYGEHGNSQFVHWSGANVNGMPLDEFASKMGADISDKDGIIAAAKKSAFDVWQKAGANCYSIAQSVSRIIEAIKYDKKEVLPVGAILSGECGLDNMCLSLPCIVGRNGIEKVLEPTFNKDELNKLKNSSDIMKSVIKDINY